MSSSVPPAADVDPPANARRPLRVLRRLALLLVVVLAVGNAGILGLSWWARTTTAVLPLDLAGVPNGVAVDGRVWRGAAPTADGYRALAAAGVTTVVDLRHDTERGPAVEVLEDLGIDLVRIPIRDGQLPTDDQVARFLDVVGAANGVVFVHCGAGVGRTGAVVAAYQATAEAAGPGMARRNLAIGPPSLEQIAYAAGGARRPPSVVVAVSRVLDAPRRIWHGLT